MDLKQKLKEQLIERLNLEDIVPEDIADDMPLFGEGLGLDSIDVLEMIVLLDTVYGIEIENAEAGRKIFYSINSIAEYIEKHRS